MDKKIEYNIMGYQWSEEFSTYLRKYYRTARGKKEFQKTINELKKYCQKIIWYDNKNRTGCWKRMA